MLTAMNSLPLSLPTMIDVFIELMSQGVFVWVLSQSSQIRRQELQWE